MESKTLGDIGNRRRRVFAVRTYLPEGQGPVVKIGSMRPMVYAVRTFPKGCGRKTSKENETPEERRDSRRDKVKEALSEFQKTFSKLWHENAAKQITGNKSLQVKAAMSLRAERKWVNTTKRIGPVPGVEVGDRFRWMAELYVVGLHCQFMNGIDYLKKVNGEVLATSIVDSGRFYDNNYVKSAQVLVYCGHGGNPRTSKNPPEDQKLEKGNLALKNSLEENSPVRVIRGFRTPGGKKNDSMYVYDGLYYVDDYGQRRGKHGKLVFVFKLKRIAGQPDIFPNENR